MKTTTTTKSRIFAAMFAAYVTAIAVPGPAHAEEADLSNVPLANSPSDAVLPNLMYILDDSRSMMWDYMPDYAHYTSANVAMKNCKDTSGGIAKESCSNGYQNGAPDGWTSTWGEPPYYSADFNQNYYDPDVYYSAPINHKGDTMGDSVYTAAARDGYTDAAQKDLSSGYSDIYYCGANSATFVGKINDGGTGTTAGKILTVTSVTFGKLRLNDVITTGANSGTTIGTQITGTTGSTGTYNVNTSQSKSTGTNFVIAVPTTPRSDILADNSVCRRNGIDNVTGSPAYFLYWKTDPATNGGLPYSGFTNRKFMTGNGHYFKISAHEYCSDVNLQTCELANADGTAPSGFDIPAPLRWCGTEADAGSTGKITSASTSTTPKCRKNFDATNFKFPRYGRFTRVNLDQASYTKSVNAVRPDCASATTCTLAEEKTNFANWYTWYRTRMAMMKSATGLAFRDINDRYRVGFVTINPMSGTTIDTGEKYLKIDKFIDSQKEDFYDILYKQSWAGGTPLREALSRVGRHYANVTTGINAGMTEDPITHSCQQNFALLTTDGYWNDDDSKTAMAQTTTGTAVGNPDNTPTSGTPVYVSRATGTIDGLGTTERIDTPVILTEQAKCTGDITVPYGEIAGGDTNKCGCTNATDARIWERKQTILQKQSYTSGEKVGGMSESPVAGTATFTPVTDCKAPRVQKYDQSMTADEYAQCSQNNSTSSGSPFSPNPQVTCSCGTGTPAKKRNYKRIRSFTRTVTLTDGVQTGTLDGTSTYSTPVAQGTGCVSTTLAVPSNTTPAAASLPGTLTSDTGTTLTVTFTPTRTPGGNPVTVTTTAKGTANTLADVAMYYYMNDLRTSMPNNVPTNDKDVAAHQHMTTFTLGLGLKGEMEYISNYETATEGDFFKIKSADIGTCSWITDPDQRCDWPKPTSGGATTLDDLWHAAVNGRGLYYSASNPLTLSNGLTNALAALKMQTAAASASATSSPNITETDNFIYSSTFRTVKWDGEVVAQKINASTGAVIGTIEWSAQANLDKRIKKVTNPGDSDDRLIYTFEPSASDGRKEFFYDQLTSTIGSTPEQKYFDNKCSGLSQCGILSTSQKDIANKGVNLVNYLRGRSEFAIVPDNAFRSREHVLGDPINATPAFISRPVFGFADDGYADFKDKWAKRQAVLYIAANDGMLHALNGDNGQELWAYVPRIVFPNLYKLASEQWIVNHEFSVDGSPQTMDVFDKTKSEWRTILVGGLNKGGRGYYALDVTDPTKGPTPMWEFCSSKELCELVDDDLGLTYGNPVITKRASDGTWVVIVTSGLNNVSPGTGKGFLYVLDAITGKVLDKVEAIDGTTTWGDTTTPSGLAKISAFANSFNSDNTATFVYGGDLYGNLWRFDMSTSPPEVLKMAQLTDSGGKPQSITSRPELGIIDGYRVVFVGTGRYLGQSDLSDPSTLDPALGWAYQQSLYAIKDKFADSKGPGYGLIRKASPGLVKQTITESSGVRTTSTEPVKWTVDDGWYVDFNPGTGAGLSPGERVNIDPQLILGTLAVVTNVPNKDACSSGGDSFLYQFDYRSGTYISTSANSAVAQKFTGKITVGLVIVRLPKGLFKGIVSDNTGGKTPAGLNLGAGGGSGRRVSWREIVK